MGLTVGWEGWMYRQSSGTRAAWPATGSAPSLVLCTNIRDVTRTQEAAELDVTTRGSNGIEESIQGLKSMPVEFEMNRNPTDADFLAFQAAFETPHAVIALFFADGDKDEDDTHGFWADFVVLMFGHDENLADPNRIKVKIKPTKTAVPGEFVTVVAA